jgi:DNA-binding NarL/FixJ family response regulator
VVRVLVVDDHPIVHLGVERLVEGAPTIQMCTGARTAKEGVAIAAAERPTVVLLDLHLPDMALPDAAAALRGACLGVKLVLFTGDIKPTVGQIAGLVGMDAVVHKDNGCAVLITAMRPRDQHRGSAGTFPARVSGAGAAGDGREQRRDRTAAAPSAEQPQRNCRRTQAPPGLAGQTEHRR